MNGKPNTQDDRTRLWYQATLYFGGKTSRPPKGISGVILEVLRGVWDDPGVWDNNKQLDDKTSDYIDQLLREPLKTFDWPSSGFAAPTHRRDDGANEAKLSSDSPSPAIMLVVNHHDRVAAAQQSIKLDLDSFAPESRAHVRLALNAIDAALIHLGMAAHAVPVPSPKSPVKKTRRSRTKP